MVRQLYACGVGLVLGGCAPGPRETGGETGGPAPPGPLTEVDSWTTERLPPLWTVGSEAEESAGTGTTTADGGPGFIVDPDGLWDSIQCSLWDQDCPDGEKCMPWANRDDGFWNATHCTPIAMDPGGAGDPCSIEGSGTSGVDDCEIGTMCWFVDSVTYQGTCVAFCGGSENNPICDDPEADCHISGDGVVPLCVYGCDPVAQSCPDGHGCYPTHETFVCAHDASGDSGAYADACEYLNVCDPGLACVVASAVVDCIPTSPGCCTPFCDLTAAEVCPGAGMECAPWFERDQAPPRYEHVGICLFPR
jgi:hypothetical protein